VLAVVVERSGIELIQGNNPYGFYGAEVRVTQVLRGAFTERRLTIWGGGGFAGPLPTPEIFPVGSSWAIVLRPMDPGILPSVGYRSGGDECEGELVRPLGPDDPSAHSLRKQLDRGTSNSIPRWRSECLSGTSDSCYALACAQEQGLGIRRDLSSARALYRRAFELRDGRIEE
jgi:hypothetical protein